MRDRFYTCTLVFQALDIARKAQQEAETEAKCAEDRVKALEVEKVSLCSRLADAENLTEDRVEKLDAMIKVRQTVELLEQQLVEKNKVSASSVQSRNSSLQLQSISISFVTFNRSNLVCRILGFLDSVY